MGLTNNDILKKIRVALKLRDDDIIRILGHVDYEITKSELGAFFRAEEHAKYMELKDQILRNFFKRTCDRKTWRNGTQETRRKLCCKKT